MLERLVSIASAEVGVREAGGNNRGARIRTYQAATDLAPGAWPWCAAFVDFAIREWLKDPEVTEWLNLRRTKPENWRPKTALAFGLLSWARIRPNTTEILPETAKSAPGDLCVFDFSHVGIVASEKGGVLSVIEGNTNGRGDRDSTSGDGVWRKSRKKSLVRNFIRINPSA